MINSYWNLTIYMMIYSLLGWIVEVIYYSIKDKKFKNRGFLNLPFNISYGILAVILIMVLPTLGKNYLLQYVVSFVAIIIVKNVTDFFIENIGKFETYEYIDEENLSNSIQNISRLFLAVICVVLYVVVHPIIFGVVIIAPDVVVKVTAIIFIAVVCIDFFGTFYAMRTGNAIRVEKINENNKYHTQNFADKIIKYIWRRLEITYPGLNKVSKEKQDRYIFAKGICLDKLIWVFLVSSFLGALIEMVYCYSLDGFWMNRSSLLYGPFSVVWGMGAVLLTVSLRRFTGEKGKNIISTFVAGFFIGGVYEYFCSVFTEIVFGTVFWDYSNMPFNIGGRTNLVYCVFWGILGIVWTRIIYPPMSREIEKLPALWGKIITWAVVVVMLCNSLLTAVAMIRYTDRRNYPEADNILEKMIDEHYNDEYMEKRWPNMVISD